MNDLDSMMPELARSEYRERIRKIALYRRLPPMQTRHFHRLRIERWRHWVGDRLIALGMRLKSVPSRQGYI